MSRLADELRNKIRAVAGELDSAQVEEILQLVHEPTRKYAEQVTNRTREVRALTPAIQAQAVEQVVRAALRGVELRADQFAGPFDGYFITPKESAVLRLKELAQSVRRRVASPL